MLDIIQKINMNQGMFAYYRGFNAQCYKFAINYGAKFLFFDELEKQMESTFQASIVTAVAVTLISYPFDLAQGRMAGDMSKKPSLMGDRNAKKKTGIFVQQQTRADRVYSSVKECLQKSEWSRGLRISLMS